MQSRALLSKEKNFRLCYLLKYKLKFLVLVKLYQFMKSQFKTNFINVQLFSEQTCKRKVLLKVITWYAYALYQIIKNSFARMSSTVIMQKLPCFQHTHGTHSIKNLASTLQHFRAGYTGYTVHVTDWSKLFTVLVITLNSHRRNFKIEFPHYILCASCEKLHTISESVWIPLNQWAVRGVNNECTFL